MFNSKKTSNNNGSLNAQEKENVAKGLNADGSEKTIELSQEEKEKNIAAGLNEDGSQKISTEEQKQDVTFVKPPTILELNTIAPESYEKSEMVINEIRVQKQCSREEAIEILSQRNQ